MIKKIEQGHSFSVMNSSYVCHPVGKKKGNMGNHSSKNRRVETYNLLDVCVYNFMLRKSTRRRELLILRRE